MTPRELYEAILGARSAEKRSRILRRHHRASTAAIVGAVDAGDIHAFCEALEVARYEPGLVPALRQIASMERPPSEAFRRAFRDFFIGSGDILRDTSRKDLVLIDALWVLLPAYRGESMRVFRGESASNRRLRTYGCSWTRERKVADAFAQGRWRLHEGGSVLVEATAAPEAIISAIPRAADMGKEREVLIDRRKLGRVRVLQRYPQVLEEGQSQIE